MSVHPTYFDLATPPLLVCPSVCPKAQCAAAVGYRLAACSLAVCGLRTRPRTDVDPLRVDLPAAGGISSRRPRGDNLSQENLANSPEIRVPH